MKMKPALEKYKHHLALEVLFCAWPCLDLVAMFVSLWALGAWQKNKEENKEQLWGKAFCRWPCSGQDLFLCPSSGLEFFHRSHSGQDFLQDVYFLNNLVSFLIGPHYSAWQNNLWVVKISARPDRWKQCQLRKPHKAKYDSNNLMKHPAKFGKLFPILRDLTAAY